MVIVDDALLLGIIAGRHDAPVQSFLSLAALGEVFTTGSWYWRLTRAINHPGPGALSRQLTALREDERQRVHSALTELPPEIGLLSLRRLVPVMSALSGQLNLLTAEAIAAAVVLEGDIVVTTESLLLARSAESAGVSLRVISL